MNAEKLTINGYIDTGHLVPVGTIMTAKSWALTMFPLIVILEYSFNSAAARRFAGYRLRCDILAIHREWVGITRSTWDWEDIESDWKLLSAPEEENVNQST